MKEEQKIVLWDKSQEHDKITEELVDKKRIYSEKQNYPELVVEDIIELIRPFIEFLATNKQQEEAEEDMRNKIYAILLKRGVNKWLFVRKMLVRLKKKYQQKIKDITQTLQEDKERYKSGDIPQLYDSLSNKEYWKLKGELKAYMKIREELKLLCFTPRWVVWCYKKVGLIDMTGVQRNKAKKWRKLFDELVNLKFENKERKRK